MEEMYYPSWRYHPNELPRIIQNYDEEQALGPGWVDTPAKFPGGEAYVPPKKRGRAPRAAEGEADADSDGE